MSREKAAGAYFTPPEAVRSLVKWAVRLPQDRLLDPSCGDGRFLGAHANSVGVEQDPASCAAAHERVPGSLIHQGDFFAWAAETRERFDCAAGNPPFIRYQRFRGTVRDTALRLCASRGARFSSLTSSWAPFLAATATLLKPGGRMAFVVPAEIGHAPYAAPLLPFMLARFSRVQVVAVRDKLFPGLAEDCWLLFADGFGGSSREIVFTAQRSFHFSPAPPRSGLRIGSSELKQWGGRLRPFLAPAASRALYQHHLAKPESRRFGDVAKIGIGYVTGANDFFHLRPSSARHHNIPDRFLQPAVRNGRSLAGGDITCERVRQWIDADLPTLLLRLSDGTRLTKDLRRYLDSHGGQEARKTFKCRHRDPWWVVPDIKVPGAFLSYMSSTVPTLVGNPAGCVGTNSVHGVHLNGAMSASDLARRWHSALTPLSCELEGHPLGGGMLKIEPGEAARILLADPLSIRLSELPDIASGVEVLRSWRHAAREATSRR